MGQRSRSRLRSDDHKYHVNSTDPERLKGFEPKFTQLLAMLGRRGDYVFKVIGSKFRVDVA